MSAMYRSRAFALCLSAALAACASSGCADANGMRDDVQVEHLSRARQSIVGGETDPFRHAVLAVGSFADGGLALCTGTLIAPNLILTARHCVTPTKQGSVQCNRDGFAAPLDPGSIGVSPATNALADGRFYAVSQVHVPPAADDVCGGDIALLILDGEFPEASAVPIGPRLDEPVRGGELYTAVGYGLNLDEGVGTRRARAGLEVTCGPLDCPGSDSFTSTEFVGDEGVCEGDSGGPALDPDGQVVGVVSRGTEDCELAVYSAVSSWRAWIREVAEEAYSEGDYERPAWLDLDGGAELASDNVAADNVAADNVVSATDPSATTNPVASGGDAGGCSVAAPGVASGELTWAAAALLAAGGLCCSRRRRHHQA